MRRKIKDNPYEKTYGLVGLTVKVKKKNPLDVIWADQWIPVTIIAEYPKFLVGVVQPHKNKHGWSESKPYTITLHKHDIATKEIKIK